MRPDEQQREQIAEEAAAWIMRLPTATADQKAKFWQWLTTSPEHTGEMLMAAFVDRALYDYFKRRNADALFKARARSVRRLRRKGATR